MTIPLRRLASATILVLQSALVRPAHAAPVIERHDPDTPASDAPARPRSIAPGTLAKAVRGTVTRGDRLDTHASARVPIKVVTSSSSSNYASTLMPAGATWQIPAWMGRANGNASFIARAIGATADGASGGTVTGATYAGTHGIRHGRGWRAPMALTMDTIITVTQGTTVTRTITIANTGMSGYAPGYFSMFMNCAGMRCTTGADGWTDEPPGGSTITRTLSITAPALILPTSYVGWIGVVAEEQDDVGAYHQTYDSVRVHFNIVAANPAAPPPAKFMSVRDSVIYVSYDSAFGYGSAIVANQAATSKIVRYALDCGTNQACWMIPSPTYLGASSQYSLTFGTRATATPVSHFAKVIASKGRDSTWGFIVEAIDTVAFDMRYGTTQAPRVLARRATRQVIPFQQVTDSFYVKNKGNDPAAYATTYDLVPHCGRFTGPCYLSVSAMTIAVGDSAQVFLTYQPDSIVTTPNDVRVRAVRRDNTTEKDSGIVHVSVVDNAAPTITVTGVTQGGAATARSTPVTITACDADGTVRMMSVRLNGTLLGPPPIATTISGCRSALRATYILTLRDGLDTLAVSASDGVHITTASRVFTYDPATEMRPRVTAMLPSGTVPINAAGVDTFVVRNPGPYEGTYLVSANCTGFAEGCWIGLFGLTVGAGASEKVAVAYDYSGSNPTGARLTLVVTYMGDYTWTSDSATSVLNAMSGTAPTIVITPPNATTVTTSSTPVTVTWCSSSALGTHDVYVDSLKLADTFQATTVSGCTVAGTSTWTNIPLKPLGQIISAVAVDAQGRHTSVGNQVSYDPPASIYKPHVTPKNTTATYPRSSAGTQLFTVTNSTAIAVTYTISATCGGYSNCAIYRPTIQLAPLSADTVRVYFTTSATTETAAAIKLVASYAAPTYATMADTGVVAASTPTYASLYQAEVRPTNISEILPSGVYVGGLAPFTVKNIGTDTATYTLSNALISTPSGAFTLQYPIDSDPLVVAPGDTKYIFPIYHTGYAGTTATEALTAGVIVGGVWKAASTGTYFLRSQDVTYSLTVAPALANPTQQAPGRSGDYVFNVTNNGTYGEFPSYTCAYGGYVTSCQVTTASAVLGPNATTAVNVSFTTSPQTSQSAYALSLTAHGNGTGTGSVTIQPPSNLPFRSVAVTPSATDPLSVLAGGTNTYAFTIKNMGNVAAVYTYAMGCTKAATSCRLTNPTWYSPPIYIPPFGWLPSLSDRIGFTTPLNPGESATVGVTYTTTSALDSLGTVALSATDTTSLATITSLGTLTLRTALLDTVRVVAHAINPGTSVNRGSCLTIAVSEDAAYECGELRVVHALPAVTAMGKTRAPTLIYGSRTSAPSATIAVEVTVNAGMTASGIDATLKLRKTGADTTLRLSQTTSYGWDANWPIGTARRITVPIDANAASLETGSYHYTLQIGAKIGSVTKIGLDTGTVVIVNRTDSPFGIGWWLDGLEQLFPVDSLQRLWVGGDGSTRMYRLVSGSPSTFVATPMVDRPDTLTWPGPGNGYRRHLRNGATVTFGPDGYHRETASITGDTTRFTWVGSHPTYITLPTSGGTSKQYSFEYTLDANSRDRLHVVWAPSPTNTEMDLNRGTSFITQPNGTLTTISRYLDGAWGPVETFGYDPSPTTAPGALSRRIISRTDRASHTTTFEYDLAGGLKRSTRNMAGTGDDIVHTFCAAETRSLTECSASPVLLDSAYTRWDGPRLASDVNDVTMFFVNRFGAPTRIRDAMARETQITYDSVFRTLAASVVSPSGHRVEMTYTARGLDSVTTEKSPVNNGDAITTYAWHPKWDLPLAIMRNFGLRTDFAYDTAFPLRLWQQDARGIAARDSFYYNAAHRIVATSVPTMAHDSIVYDGTLGNVAAVKSRAGYWTTMLHDAIGRDTMVTSPGGAMTTYTTYDPLDRVKQTRSVGAANGGSTAKTLTVDNQYDTSDNLKLVTRSISPDPLNLQALRLGSDYDYAGRKIREYDPDQPSGYQTTMEWVYDAAGNLRTTTRGGVATTAEYDVLNRVQHRVVNNVVGGATSTPFADNQYFTYDVAGNLATANNYAAHVARTYFPNGAVSTDTLHIATSNLSASLPFDQHVYSNTYQYDVLGRRLTLASSSLSGVLAPVTYGYDSQSGGLATITSNGIGTYTYYESMAGALDSLYQPDGSVERRTYDVGGQLLRRTEKRGSWTLHDATFTRNGLGQMLQATGLTAETETYSYDGLGAVVGTSGRVTPAKGAATGEETPRDALGNMVEHHKGADYQEYFKYQPHSTRLWFSGRSTSATDPFSTDSLEQRYSTSGDVVQIFTRNQGPMWCADTHAVCGMQDNTRRLLDYSTTTHEYNSEGHLVRSVKTTSNDNSHGWAPAGLRAVNQPVYSDALERGVIEEHRYDALGRRVWVRANRETGCPVASERDSTSVCLSTVERTMYDGDQVLAEIRQPAEDSLPAAVLEMDVVGTRGPVNHFGLVGYLNGPGIDHPLALRRQYASGGGTTVAILHSNWQGAVDLSTTTGGLLMECTVSSYPYCEPILWPGANMTYGLGAPRPTGGAPSWWGTLASGKENAAGGRDMRNRVYDPRTGRFTQEDPIGLAGGMNLYGFAGGDPVNFSDPFGLMPCPPCDPGSYSRDLAEGMWNTAVQTVKDAGNSITVYAKATLGSISGEVATKLYGSGSSAQFGGEVGTDGASAVGGVRMDLSPPGPNVRTFTVSTPGIPIGGGASVAGTATVSRSSSGGLKIHSAGIEAGYSATRLGIERLPGISTPVRSLPGTCTGTLCQSP
ncbi:MAG: hypothetical protein JWM95_675 [Gemmatimonadetes bacterium]|nr:hypothetical protein [Gemmatimonadota bacterium]